MQYQYEIYHAGPGDKTIHIIKQWNNTLNQDNQTLFSLGFMEMIPSPRLGFLIGVFLVNHLSSTDSLTKTTKRWNTYQLK